MDTEEILIRALLTIELCNTICKNGYILNGYSDCDITHCINHSEFILDIEKLKKEYCLE